MSKTNTSALITLVSVFFFWGFVAASNDILIPVFKEKLGLEQWQGQLISVAFYVAYTVGSIFYLVLSKIFGGDILNRLGYKNGIALGLTISAAGTLLFIPAAAMVSFGMMITGLFIVALGFSLQQTAANPMAINIGDTSKGSQRLSLAGGVNNVGTTIGPILLSYAIFGSVNSDAKLDSLDAIKIPYLILGAAFLVVAMIFKFSKLPNHIETDVVNQETVISENKKSVFSYPQLWMGMIAIFVYVGVEVSTASNLPEFMRQHLGTETKKMAPFISLFWASLMIGRWTASVEAFNLKGMAEKVLRFLMPYIAFLLYILVNLIAGHDISSLYLYALVIVAMIIGDLLSKGNPARQLLIFSSMGILSLIIGMLADGMVSVYAFISVGLFCSTLWPCIFTLAIAGLGKKTNEGSSFLIMMIMGGGLISFLQGWLAGDERLGIQWSYLVGVACFAYLAFYAWKVAGILRNQGIDYDQKTQSSH